MVKPPSLSTGATILSTFGLLWVIRCLVVLIDTKLSFKGYLYLAVWKGSKSYLIFTGQSGEIRTQMQLIFGRE